MLPRPVATGLTVLVSLMWAVNLTVGYLYPGRSDPYVSAIFGIVVVAVYQLGRKNNAQLRQARRRLGEAIIGQDEPTGEDDEQDSPGEDEQQ